MDISNFAQDFSAYAEAGMMATTVYLTVISGYLISIYLVGTKLSNSQLLTITILFAAFALLFAFGSYSFFDLALTLVGQNPGPYYSVTKHMPLVTFSVELAGIAAAIKFMIEIRAKE